MYYSNADIIKVNEYIIKHKKEFNKEIGKLIKLNRIQKNVDSKTFSERTMISENYIRQIENGSYGLTLSKLIIISNALEIPPYDIIDNFTFSYKKIEDLLYNKLQNNKNISKNIFDFLKEKPLEI